MAIHRGKNTIKKEQPEAPESSLFTQEESAFIVSKLREANYKGTEFEIFYKIMSKLAKLANNT